MSVDLDGENCPRCRSRAMDKARAFGRTFTACSSCGHQDEGYFQARIDMERHNREAKRKRQNVKRRTT